MGKSIRFATFPRTVPPPDFARAVVDVFRAHEAKISTVDLAKGLESDMVLAAIRPDLLNLGFEVESGKTSEAKIKRPVFFGDDGEARLEYQVDAYHQGWRCGLEVEAGRSWLGNAVYRDVVQAMVMVQVDYLALAVPNAYRYRANGKPLTCPAFKNAREVAEALYGHTRVRMPYGLLLIGY
jgi:hypothetical protein